MTSTLHSPSPANDPSQAAAPNGASCTAEPDGPSRTVEWAVRDREERIAENCALSWLTFSGLAALTGAVFAVVALV
jgi:hypothetical protein